MKRIIGVTGGVGSGKSKVLKILAEEFGVHVIPADDVAKELMKPGQEGQRRVAEYLGEAVLNPDGSINRPAMAQVIFHDEEKRRRVNQLTHPLVWEAIQKEAEESAASLVAVEAAIVDKEFRDNCQEMWYVYTSRENRRQRLADSRGYSDEKTSSIIDSQQTEEEFRRACTHLIDNNGTLEDTRRQICRLLEGNCQTRSGEPAGSREESK